ncbi:mannose-1-phosphate guanylyltransferase [Thermotomaculum hydrothermale]|uniref:mannose-1-phosphate guanylyltransferase n=1 Tax=Thermotomaculum hydrothermale TaxID=981385 RepID=A0A7R6PNM2_9BACT|nr:mannose-1-phosphate guanylyltransferase/mannose-6-phosphate isomerase [Thermotomaculum hydrothermale]BBB33412.1 mannose-1-phosphate guanylyltransferase [Thermotomaculum hydrothermale]
MREIVNIVLAGGSGTRLWPISRTLLPKQFLKLNGHYSFFQQTILRHKEFTDKTIVVVNDSQYFLALEQLEEINMEDKVLFVIESVGRNTAPAICLASMLLRGEDIAIVTPSDHLITDNENYKKDFEASIKYLSDNKILTFGIKPDSPNTDYGYIETGETLEKNIYQTVKFHEKPEKETALAYLKKGNFLWNSGIFAFKIKSYLNELEKFEPEMYKACEETFLDSKMNGNLIRFKRELMEKIPANSIDYAVMEKTDRGITRLASFDWSDVGSFDSLYTIHEKDQNNNTVYKPENLINIDSKNNLIITSKGRSMVTIDINDLIVVDTKDAVLISNKGSSSKVKEAVKILKEKNSEIVESHITTFRPWGSFTVLASNKRYKVKKIYVKPHRRLSLQLHKHRSEHWVVVTGQAKVTIGNAVMLIKENESVYVPIGEKHRLENPTDKDLEIIEIQVGFPLTEDDIVRIEDDYKRE